MDVLAAILGCSMYMDDNLTRAIMESTSQSNPYFVQNTSLDFAPPEALPTNADEATTRAETIAAHGGRAVLGVMQIPMVWLTTFGRTTRDAFNPCINVTIGTAMLSQFALRVPAHVRAKQQQREHAALHSPQVRQRIRDARLRSHHEPRATRSAPLRSRNGGQRSTVRPGARGKPALHLGAVPRYAVAVTEKMAEERRFTGQRARRSDQGRMKILTSVLVLLGSLQPACSSEARPSPYSPSTAPPSASCAQTLCDLKAAHCTNPPERDDCDDCWTACRDNLGAPHTCAEARGSLSSPSRADQWFREQLAACRRTSQESICVDGVEEPSRGHPCGDVASRVSCAAGYDLDAQRAIYEVNPACKQCDEGWRDRCLGAVCKVESRALSACARKPRARSHTPASDARTSARLMRSACHVR